MTRGKTKSWRAMAIYTNMHANREHSPQILPLTCRSCPTQRRIGIFGVFGLGVFIRVPCRGPLIMMIEPDSDMRTWGMLCHLAAFSGYFIAGFGWILGPLISG